MARKEQAVSMSVWCLLLYGFVTLAYSSVAYSAGLGRADCPIVTDCFDNGSAAYTLRIGLCIALILSHPVTLFPASEIMENLLMSWSANERASGKSSELTTLLMVEEKEKDVEPRKFKFGKALRVFNVCLTLVVGYLFKDFSSFSNIIGAIGLTLVGFVFPPILYLKATKRNNVTVGLGTKVTIFGCFFLAAFNLLFVGFEAVV
jgi:hypothetical protein